MYSVTIKKDSLLVYVLKFFQILAGNNFSKFWRSSVVARERERDWDTKGPGSNAGLRFSFFLLEALSKTGQSFSKCLRNGSDRLRKGQLPRRNDLIGWRTGRPRNDCKSCFTSTSCTALST